LPYNNSKNDNSYHDISNNNNNNCFML